MLGGGVRPGVGQRWGDLPAAVRAVVEQRFGTAARAQVAPAGRSAALRCRLDTGQGAVWVKALPQASPAAVRLRHEVAVGRVLPAGVPAPGLLWGGLVDRWWVGVWEAVAAGPASLEPGAGPVEVVRALRACRRALSPCPWRRGPHVWASTLAGLWVKARQATAQPPASLPRLRLAGEVMRRTEGLEHPRRWPREVLCHGDMNPRNLLARAGGVVLVDWAHAGAGPAWLDAALLVPRLVAAGHTPAEAERLVAGMPGWRDAQVEITVLAAVLAGAAAWGALCGPVALRHARSRGAAACLTWLAYREGVLGDVHDGR